jgi:translation initiation factor IF-2
MNTRTIELTEPLSVRELAERLETTPISIIKKLMAMGVMANINQTLDVDTATLVSEVLVRVDDRIERIVAGELRWG